MLMLRERSGKTRSLSDGQCDNLPLEYAILRRSDSKCAVGLEECELLTGLERDVGGLAACAPWSERIVF